MNVYPIFLNDLTNRRAVAFGLGHDTLPRIQGLLDAGALVDYVHPILDASLSGFVVHPRFNWHARKYRKGDLVGAFLTVVTEIDPEATHPIWQEAQAEHVLMNAVDDVAHCSFVAGSIVRRGPIVVAVSSSGTAPSLAVRLREQIEGLVTASHGRLAEMLGALRPAMKRRHPSFQERRSRWYAMVDSPALHLLETDRVDEARQVLHRIADVEDANTSPTA